MKKFILVAAIFLMIIGTYFFISLITLKKPNNIQSQPKTDIQNSIEHAIDFLSVRQSDLGGFETLTCQDYYLFQCRSDISPFIDSYIAYSVMGIKSDKAQNIERKILDLLEKEKESGSIWRFWPFDQERVMPDSDDTAVVSALLTLSNRKIEDNLSAFEKWRSKNGAIYTWMSNDEKKEVDCEVNSNVLFYLGIREKKDQKICNFVNNQIVKENFSCCVYCKRGADSNSEINTSFLFYTISRAYHHGNQCLGVSRDKIIEKIKLAQQSDGSFGGPLDSALDLNTLMNFGYKGREVDAGINNLLLKQGSDGSWPAATFFIGRGSYFGSRELATALAIEALNKYSIY